MSAPTTPLKWSSKKRDTHAASASASREYHLKSPSNASYHYQPPSTQQRSPNSVAGVGTRGGSTHSSNGARSRAGSTSSGSGRMTAVFCDVVVEGAGRTSDGWDLPPGKYRDASLFLLTVSPWLTLWWCKNMTQKSCPFYQRWDQH